MALLTDLSVRAYAAGLASGDPTPGGGSAAALAGALGVSLTLMVGAFTEGRSKYAEHTDFIAELLARSRDIQDGLIRLVDEDAEAFKALGTALSLSKATEAVKSDRKAAIQSALKSCAVVPYSVLELCSDALDYTGCAINKTNKNVASDLGVAAACLKAAAQSAWLNVLINLKSIDDDEFTSEYRQKGEALLTHIQATADAVYDAVKHAIE